MLDTLGGAPFVVTDILRRALGDALTAVGPLPSNLELAAEAAIAYKDVDRVVNVVHGAGIARKVARLRPLGVVKG